MDNPHYVMMAKIIDDLARAEPGAAADLSALSARYGYEATYFQKLFKDYVGVSPKRLSQFMTYNRAREFLLQGYTTLEAAYEAGLSGNGRLHDLFVSIEGASPGVVQSRGAGLQITYGFHATPLGEMLIAQTALGVCWAAFVMAGGSEAAIDRMKSHWPKADFICGQQETSISAERILMIWRGDATDKIKLNLYGTNFQLQVWRALLQIPSGCVVNYGAIAAALGDPKASRAVGTAIGRNPVAVLIPCHRVIQSSGIVENYAWGTTRKRMLLGLEAAENNGSALDCI